LRPRTSEKPRRGWPSSTRKIAGELHDGDSEDGAALLCLHKALPCGYHRLTIAGVTGDTLLIVTPGRCFLPPALENGARVWGIAAQLYLLRSEADWGIGGYGELEQLVDMAAGWDADVVGVNPLHAMFFDDPEQASPYSPASRLFLNILNIDRRCRIWCPPMSHRSPGWPNFMTPRLRKSPSDR
jgi:hypothetical protein